MKKKLVTSKKIDLKKVEISTLNKLSSISGGFGPQGHGTHTGGMCTAHTNYSCYDNCEQQ